ncbi:MAG: PilC/PilY family type IV pilus protein [Steroidobacteraceae bacterium]
MKMPSKARPLFWRFAVAAYSFGMTLALPVNAAPPPNVPITQVPMTVVIPAHPQIVLALGNSQSMDGDLSGAIYTGSGGLGTYPELASSSSPVNYTIPGGFTPPVNPGSGGTAPYTVVSAGGVQTDNSASRLNVAKAGITSILNNYIADADFALLDYQVGGLNEYTTWVYQMSQPGGFTFTSIPGANESVANPCYQVNPFVGDTVASDCVQLAFHYGWGAGVFTQPYMIVGASSDDPQINDVLYAGNYFDPVCVVFNGPNPPTPFPPYDNIVSYENGWVYEQYYNEVNSCATITGPTNAGYVPYSQEVMYEERGFGFYTFSESSTTGNVVVPMTSAGGTPTPTTVATALAAFTPSLAPETNQSGSADIKASATQSPIAGLLQGAGTIFSHNPPTTNGCVAQRYVVLVTDGLPTMDLSGYSWPPLGSSAAAGYGVSATFDLPPAPAPAPNGTGALLSTNDQAMTDTIKAIQALNSGPNPIKTYIIGLGAGVNQAVNPVAWQTLTAMAYAGGTTNFFPANSPGQVTDDLQIIITQILAATQATSSAAVNSTGLNTSSVVYQSQFTTSDLYQDWTGNLFAYPINPNTGVTGAALWSSQTQLDAQPWDTGRLIATWDPVAGNAIPFQWNTGTPASGIATSTVLGQDLETFAADTNGQDVLQFLRGANAKEVRNGGQFRNRTHKLGDIVNSNPVYIGTPTSSNQSTSYLAFAQTNANRPPVLYVGANDGMLHAFDATTGNERFAYMPTGSYANLAKLANPYYNAVHQFYVNGSPQAFDVQFTDLSWHTLLVSAEAQGGNSVFAMDVSNPANITSESALASAVLWDFTDPDMGLGFSTPSIASTADGWQVFFGNGYNSAHGKPFLYALDPQHGTITAKIDLCAAVPTACNLAAANGLSTAIVVNSGGVLAGFANLVYAGDLQGNLWRVDISNTNPTLWTVSVLFQARDSSGHVQPIETSPVATLNPRYPQVLGTMVFFATGQFLGTPDLSNTHTQTIYGVYDPPSGYASPMLRANLQQQILSTTMLAGNTVAVVTSNAVSIPAIKGWYIDLTLLSGERAVTDPRLESGGALVLTTYAPNSNVCVGGGSAYLYVLNYATGGAFPSPQFDANHDGSVNSGDSTPLGNPVGEFLGNIFATGATIRSNPAGAMKLITESNGTILPVQEVGNSKSRTAWWEIRK